jgi:hypothetical protein
MRCRSLFGVGLLLVAAGTAQSQPRFALSIDKAQPDPTLNALFERKDGWIGADGAYSVEMSPSRHVWLFSDTWVGRVKDRRRCDATIVNNSVGVQVGRDATAKLQFTVGRDKAGKSAAIFTPSDGRGWFWLQAGAYVDKHLVVFLSQVEKTNATDVFGFRQIGQSLAIISNPEADPADWRYEQSKLPCAIFSPERQLSFGTAGIRDSEHLYVYGTDEEIRPAGRDRYLILARVPLSHVQDFAEWRFYDGQGWSADFRASKRLLNGMANEGSVSYLPDLKQYVLVYTEAGLSDRILARSAPAPPGPWSTPTVLYRCPEPGRDKRIFCYAAKAHSALATGHDLVVSYVSNSFDFGQVAADASIYLPRFIRVKYRSGK